MPIINKYDSYYLHPVTGPKQLPITTIDIHCDFSDRDYWHVSCFDGSSLRYLKDLIPDTILNRLRKKTLCISISSEYEAFNDVPELVYEYIIVQLSIPAESVLLISGNFRIQEITDHVALSLGLPKIKTKWVCVMEKVIASKKTTILDTLQIKDYPKKFLCLNRRWRSCRLALISYLKIYNLLDCGFVSLRSVEGRSWNNSWEHMLQYQDPSTIQIFEQNKDKIVNIPELSLDDTRVDDMNLVTNKLDYYYLNSYFSIVGGSIFYEREIPKVIGLCEKTFKAIQKKHPFILISTANNLPYLRDMGYKTFDGLIDESYDKEIDDNKRMRMIVAEIKRLCNLNPEELRYFLVQAKKIVEHNYNVLLEKNQKTA